MKYYRLLSFGLLLGIICLSILIHNFNTETQEVNIKCESETNLTYSYYNYSTGEVTHKPSNHKVCNIIT